MKGNSEENDLNFQRFQVIQEWCIKNFPSISSYIKVKIKNRQGTKNSSNSDQLFRNERKNAHYQLKYNIITYKNKITDNISSNKENLNNLVSQPIPPLGCTCYDKQKMNLDVHKLLFSTQLAHKLKIKIITLRIEILLSIIEKIDKALEIIDECDDDVIIIIDKAFFEMESIIQTSNNQASSSSSSNKIDGLNQNSATSSTFSEQIFETSSLTSSNSLLNSSNPQTKYIYLDSSIIPTSYSFSPQTNSPTYQQYISLLIRVTHYCNHLSYKIRNKYPKPLWINDFALFIEKSVQGSLPRFDFDLSYLLPQECELSINRALFSNAMRSTEPIDVILRSFKKILPNSFMIELMSMCYKVLPQKLLRKFKPEELSISLTFIFRVLFDRIYEKNFESEGNIMSAGEARLAEMIQSYNEKKEKFIKMKKLTMSAFIWPHEYIPSRPFIVSHGDLSSLSSNDSNKVTKLITDDNNFNEAAASNASESTKIFNNNDKSSNKPTVTTESTIKFNNSDNSLNQTNNDDQHISNSNKIGLDDFVANMPVRQFFRTDYYFSPAIEFLELTNFCTNPIDTLYYIHKCLISVQKAAIIHSINKRKKRQATASELNQVICFDDLFGLTLGVFLASDVPDIFALNWFVQNYSPRNELSPPLEYAKANLEGLTQHIAVVNLEDDKIK